MKKLTLLCAALCVLLSSCYFNSAGHLFGMGAYKASADSADAKVGQQVYMYNDGYYVELPRYRKGKQIVTQYAAWDDEEPKDGLHPTGDKTLFRIPADFAMYLTGRASSPTVPSYMTPVEEEDDIKRRSVTYPIVRNGGTSTHDFNYSSPNAVWWYTAGVFEWLCVDLPVTITENALTATGLALAGVALIVTEMNSDKTTTTNSGTASSSGTTAYSDNYSSYSSSSWDECSECGGTGSIRTGRTGNNYLFLSRGSRTCPSCGGSGRSNNKCSRCDGSGYISTGRTGNNYLFLSRGRSTCPSCGGTGES